MGERAWELAQVRRGVHPTEQQRHAAVAQLVQVIDRVPPVSMPRHDRGDLAHSVGSLIGWHTGPFTDDACRAHDSAKRITSSSPADTRFGSLNDARTVGGAVLVASPRRVPSRTG